MRNVLVEVREDGINPAADRSNIKDIMDFIVRIKGWVCFFNNRCPAFPK